MIPTPAQSQGSILAAARANARSLDEQRNGVRIPVPSPVQFVADPSEAPPMSPPRTVTVPNPAESAARMAQLLASMQGDAAAQAVAESEARMRALVDERMDELAKRVQAVATVDPAKLRDEARAALLDEIGKAGAVDSALAGTAPILPPLRPVDPEYVSTTTGKLIARALKKGRRFILVSGPSGSGKTYPAEMECRALSRRALKLSCADGVTRADLIARQTASAGSTGWQEGSLALAMRQGLVLILDEMDKLDALVLASLNSALEREPSLLLPWGEVLTPADGFCVIGTCNGLTDESGLYTVHTLSADLPNRAGGGLVHADYLPASEEIAIIEGRTKLAKSKAERIVAALGKLRELVAKSALSAAPSLRVGLAVAEEISGVDPVASDVAWSLAMLNGLKPTERRAAQSAIASVNAWSL